MYIIILCIYIYTIHDTLKLYLESPWFTYFPFSPQFGKSNVIDLFNDTSNSKYSPYTFGCQWWIPSDGSIWIRQTRWRFSNDHLGLKGILWNSYSKFYGHKLEWSSGTKGNIPINYGIRSWNACRVTPPGGQTGGMAQQVREPMAPLTAMLVSHHHFCEPIKEPTGWRIP